MNTEHFEYLRNQAMNEFNFKRVYEFMKFVDWTWKRDSDDGYIPSIRMLKRSVFNDFQQLYESDKTNISSGGFTVTLDDDGAGINFTCEEVFIDTEYDSNENKLVD